MGRSVTRRNYESGVLWGLREDHPPKPTRSPIKYITVTRADQGGEAEPVKPEGDPLYGRDRNHNGHSRRRR